MRKLIVFGTRMSSTKPPLALPDRTATMVSSPSSFVKQARKIASLVGVSDPIVFWGWKV